MFTTPNDISIGSAVLCRTHERNQETHIQTDRQTDHPTPFVATGRIKL